MEIEKENTLNSFKFTQNTKDNLENVITLTK